jgi:hypothetical protein
MIRHKSLQEIDRRRKNCKSCHPRTSRSCQRPPLCHGTHWNQPTGANLTPLLQKSNKWKGRPSPTSPLQGSLPSIVLCVPAEFNASLCTPKAQYLQVLSPSTLRIIRQDELLALRSSGSRVSFPSQAGCTEIPGWPCWMAMFVNHIAHLPEHPPPTVSSPPPGLCSRVPSNYSMRPRTVKRSFSVRTVPRHGALSDPTPDPS